MMSHIGRRIALALGLMLTVAVASQTNAADHDVDVFNFGFNPATLTIGAGDSVTWTVSSGTHSIVSSGGGFADHPAPMSSGAAHTATFTNEGSFPYACGIHPSMQGTITVTGATSPSAPPPSIPPSAPPAPSLTTAPTATEAANDIDSSHGSVLPMVGVALAGLTAALIVLRLRGVPGRR